MHDIDHYLPPDGWDPINPRTAAEYSANIPRRIRNKSRRITTIVQRLLVGSYLIFSWAVILALLVGAR